MMKDLYSFSRNQAEHDTFYAAISDAYTRVYKRLGIGDSTYKTFASGGSFSKYSHEYQTLSDVGEDVIYVHQAKKIAINQEVYTDEVLQDLGVSKDELVEYKAVEVGNTFTLATKFSDPLALTFTDEDGSIKPVIMGSYGIGPSRLVGLLAEHFADERGLVWPENVAPFMVYIAQLGNDDEVVNASQQLYNDLIAKGITVFWDDRDARPGEKFADADLYGIPYRVVISQKSIESGQFELKKRTDSDPQFVSQSDLLKSLGA